MPGITAIDGIVSNLNTTQIVDTIIAAEHRSVDRLTDRKSDVTNQLTTYQSVSAKILAMQAALNPLLKASTFDVSSVNLSDDSALSVTTNGKVTSGSYSISIDALATNHQIASQGYEDASESTLGTGTLQISLGTASPHTFVIDASNDSLISLKNAINAAHIGVTASVVKDGTDTNAFRLMLTADKTGTDNAITVTSNVSGTDLNFSTSSFDNVEKSVFASGTSGITLGAGASYTGSANKTYTFTVQGSGSQTVGSGPITINWSDGTNSGTFDVDSADTEVALTGTGADGLTLSFAAGTLTEGDTFYVQTFAPLLQAASDARISLGSTAGGGSPITITSSSNQIDDVIGGLSLNLKAVTAAPVQITTDLDKDSIKSSITTFLDAYNDVMRAIDEQYAYDPETQQGGRLLGDAFLLQLQSGLRYSLTGALPESGDSPRTLRALGIRTSDIGLMTLVNTTELYDMLENDLEGVRRMFTDTGSSDNAAIRFLASSTSTDEIEGGFAVDITQAATRMVLQGDTITDPSLTPLTIDSTNNTIKLKIEGRLSKDLVLTSKSYGSGAELANELQSKIDSDSIIGEMGVSVEWIDDGDNGYLKFTSGSYGSDSTVKFESPSSSNGASILGFADGGTAIAGKDVAGTINGETATGNGRILTGDADNDTTAGLSLEVSLGESDIVSGREATLTFVRGFASRLNRVADSISRSVDGSIARRTKGLNTQIADLSDQIADQEERLAVRREKLFQRFYALEQALGEFQTQGAFLSAQLSQISANTQYMTSSIGS